MMRSNPGCIQSAVFPLPVLRQIRPPDAQKSTPFWVNVAPRGCFGRNSGPPWIGALFCIASHLLALQRLQLMHWRTALACRRQLCANGNQRNSRGHTDRKSDACCGGRPSRHACYQSRPAWGCAGQNKHPETEDRSLYCFVDPIITGDWTAQNVEGVDELKII
jgi:hypothetical protein